MASLEARGMKSRGQPALLTQRVRGPETLARGTPRLHSLGRLPEAQAMPPLLLRLRGLYLSGLRGGPKHAFFSPTQGVPGQVT